MGEAFRIQCTADGQYAAVHHIGRRNHVGACAHMGEGHLAQQFEGLVVVDGGAAVQNAAVSVGGIFAHAHVGDAVYLWEVLFDLPQCLLYDAVFIPCRGTQLILVGGDSKQQDLVYAGLYKLLHRLAYRIGAVVVLSRQRRNLLAHAGFFADKQRVNQSPLGDVGFPRQFAHHLVGSQTSWSVQHFHSG